MVSSRKISSNCRKSSHARAISFDLDRFVKDLRKFIGQDLYGSDSSSVEPLSAQERRVLSTLEATTRLTHGPAGTRYEVRILWRDADPNLPDNYRQALRRFYAQEARLLNNPELAKKCSKAMQELHDLGHVRKLTPAELATGTPGRTWYNPCHPVINPNKPDKFRMVFYFTALFDGVSINSKILKGPNLLSNLVSVMLRFRRYRVGLMADITKMFHQVRVRPEDASAYRYFWREPSSADQPDVFEFLAHLFGATSSPAVCSYALQRAVKDSEPYAEELLEQVKDQFYMDNWTTSFGDTQEAVKIGRLMIDARKRAGFELSQFASSVPEIFKELGVSVDLADSVDLPLEKEATERFLGFIWSWAHDTLKDLDPRCNEARTA